MQMQAEKILADVLVETPVKDTHPALAERIDAFLRKREEDMAEMDAHMDATEPAPATIPVVRGIRLTDCCSDTSSYMDDGKGNEALCCRTCYRQVPAGQGDGSEVAR